MTFGPMLVPHESDSLSPSVADNCDAAILGKIMGLAMIGYSFGKLSSIAQRVKAF